MKRDDLSKKDKIISCAECRSKCDRQFPCSSWYVEREPEIDLELIWYSCSRRRGLASLCPDSSLITRPRKTPQLSKKGTTIVAKMSDRIKQLEEALGSLQAKHSTEPHPLLVDPDSTELDDEGVGLEDSIGTLAIDPESGTASFYGHSAGMEHELPDLPKRTSAEIGRSMESFDVLRDSILYPLFINIPDEGSIREHLEAYLPDHQEARRLRDIYYESASWLYSSVPRPVTDDYVFNPVYNLSVPSLVACSHPLVATGTLFLVFAISSCLDLQNPSSDNTERFRKAGRYYQLARAALSGEGSMLEIPNLPTVRALMLMIFYHLLLDEDETPQIVWSLLSLATGLTFGRPPTLSRHFIDCEINPDEPIQLPDGRTKHGNRYRVELMSSTILPEIAEFILSSSKHKYSDVLLMDRKLRDCAVEVFGGAVGSQPSVDDLKDQTTSEVMRNFFVLASKETLSIYLHRKYFVRVCASPGSDYLTISRYSPSFFAALRSAQTLIKLLGFLLELEPELPCRFWHFWSHALASAIIVSSVVIQHPRCVLAPEAMVSMEAIYSQLCQWAARDSLYDRPKRVLKTVGQLREKARQALETGVGRNLTNPAEKGIDLGLSLLAGSARVVSTVPKTSSSSSAIPSSATSTESPASAPVGELHPHLLEDMNSVLGRDFEKRTIFDLSLPSSTIGTPQLQQQLQGHMYQTYTTVGYDNINMDANPTQMYQNQISEFGNHLQQQQEQQQQAPSSLEMLAATYGYPMQQPSWPGVLKGYDLYQMEENYPEDDDGAWQGIVAGLGIST
ncbi:hypothetical protein Clacol_009331 [Clathrus columnatus]|uniref:Transcription factor domain-containing protein n=1 Tax=Clathrus columnatus TaxID=1419009 RepID=A0AAV5AQ91_9AGAM|nr:hypothetical protein Clacol_009331 [Clathrus columnatus]